MTAARSDLMALAAKLRRADVSRFPWLAFTEAIKDALINARSSLKAFGGDPRPQIARYGEGDEIQAAVLNGIDEALSLLSGAGTKSDGGACGKSSQASQHHNVDLQPPPSDPSPGPDVREALEESSQTLEYLRREARTWGKIFSVNVDHVLDKNRKALSALTRPLGGFVQGSIADGGQCNEQSPQGLSQAIVGAWPALTWWEAASLNAEFSASLNEYIVTFKSPRGDDWRSAGKELRARNSGDAR